MNAARTLRRARRAAGLTKRALARHGRTSPAAVVMYESGTRAPTVPTLDRLLAAAGWRSELVLVPAAGQPDPAVSGARLAEVLELAEHLPHRRAPRRLPYPPFRNFR